MSSQSGASTCPLCSTQQVLSFAQLRDKEYFRCEVCRLAYLLPQYFVTAEAARAHYRTHQNNPEDSGYRAFLSRLSVPLVRHLNAGAQGLDYGSGPGPTLSVMLEEQGFAMEIYDPFFAPNAGVLHRTYDFITCTETAEHFHAPREEFARFDRLLRPGGWLAVMTEMMQDGCDFEKWYYRRDPTHVCFYSQVTMNWIANHFCWTVEFPHRNVALFRKSTRSEAAG